MTAGLQTSVICGLTWAGSLTCERHCCSLLSVGSRGLGPGCRCRSRLRVGCVLRGSGFPNGGVVKRCLTCGNPSSGAACDSCKRERKRLRSAHAREIGPCPQDVACYRCGGGSGGNNRRGAMTWDHLKPLSVAPNQYFKVGSIVRISIPVPGLRVPVVIAEARTPGGVPLARSAHASCNTSRSNRRLTGAGPA